MRTYQGGSTLIVVMALLVIITIIGTLAIRNSSVSLNIATNSQAQQIMTQSSDASLFNLQDKSQLNRYLARNGLLGYMKDEVNKEKELVFCIRNTATRFFDINKASIISWESGKPGPTNNSIGEEGYCKVEESSDYVSGRKAVMTQVALRYTSTPADPFQLMTRGTDPVSGKLEDSVRLLVYSISLMPTLASDVDITKINTCLSKHLNLAIEPIDASYDSNNASQVTANENGKISVAQCLKKLNVPYTTQIAEYKLYQDL